VEDADNPSGYVGMGWGVRKWPRAEDRVTFEDDVPDLNGLPGIRIAYEVTDREEAEMEHARTFQARAAQVLGSFIDGMPVVMPPGSSLHTGIAPSTSSAGSCCRATSEAPEDCGALTSGFASHPFAPRFMVDPVSIQIFCGAVAA